MQQSEIRLSGLAAIEYAIASSLTLSTDEREGVTVDEALLIARENPREIWIRIIPARYHIRVIAGKDDALGDLLITTDDIKEAKATADRLWTSRYYGVAIIDTLDRTVDWGDRTTTY